MLSAELRDKLRDFVESNIRISDLEEWLVPRLPFFLRFPNSTDADVVSAVELGLAHMANSITTKDEFRDYLKQLLQAQTAISTNYPFATYLNVETSSSNRTEPTSILTFGDQFALSHISTE